MLFLRFPFYTQGRRNLPQKFKRCPFQTVFAEEANLGHNQAVINPVFQTFQSINTLKLYASDKSL